MSQLLVSQQWFAQVLVGAKSSTSCVHQNGDLGHSALYILSTMKLQSAILSLSFTVSGLYNCIELLVEHGADPGTADIHGAYPLHYAAQMCGDPNTESTGTKDSSVFIVQPSSIGEFLYPNLVEELLPLISIQHSHRQWKLGEISPPKICSVYQQYFI